MMPASRIASIKSDVATGRRMNGRDGLIAGSSSVRHARAAWNSAAALPAAAFARRLVRAGRSLAGRCRLSRTPGGGIDKLHLRTVAQLVGAVDHDEISRLESALHFGVLALGCAQLDGRHGNGLILLDHEHEGAGGAALD